MRQVFLDTETTGLSPEAGDRLVEIGCVEMVGRQLTGDNRHFYLNPERKCSDEARRIHGLTDEFLADKPRFAEVVDGLMSYLAGAEVIIHNAAFDVGFLTMELRRLARQPFAEQVAKVTDSWVMAREQFPGKSNSLDALCRRLEVDNSGRTLHGALLDAELLAEVYIRMTRGQHSFSMEVDSTDGQASPLLALGAIDVSAYVLPVCEPSATETAAHEKIISELDKAAGLAIWRKMLP